MTVDNAAQPERRRSSRRIAAWRVGGTTLLGIVVLAVAFMPAGPGQPRRFTDVATEEMADADRLSEAACWGDMDADGDQDLFVVNYQGGSRLWRNDGAGAFTDVAASAGVDSVLRPIGCSFVDLDYDGNLDLYITTRRSRGRQRGRLPSQNVLFENAGDARFRDITEEAGVGAQENSSASVDWADYDGDGDLDAFVASRWGQRDRLNHLFRQRAPFRFDDMGQAAGVADPPGPPRAFLGSWFDYDADGDLDLLIAVDFWGVELYRNTGGRFVRATAEVLPAAHDTTPGAPPNNPMGVTWGDYDNDGCPDVFITGLNVPGQAGFGAETLGDLASRLFRNTCKGAFSDATLAAGFRPTGTVEWSANFVDFDNDGDLDLSIVAGNATAPGRHGLLGYPARILSVLVALPRRVIPYRVAAWAYRYEAMIPARGNAGPGGAMPNFLYQNRLVETGQAIFVDVTQEMGVATLGTSRGSAWADMDGDGDLDWFIPGRRTPNRLFRNDGPVGNFLRVRLVGRGRSTVGSWVKIRTGQTVQFRHVHVLDGYLSQSQMDPHFGLGTTTRVDEVWVRWPNSTAWRLICEAVPANGIVTLMEDAGCRW